MSLPDKNKKRLCSRGDRYRAITEHMIFQYDQFMAGSSVRFFFMFLIRELGREWDTAQAKYLSGAFGLLREPSCIC